MFITGHARARLHERLSPNLRLMGAIIGALEAVPGEPGTVAYIVERLDKPVQTESSNGDVVVAVAVDGSVDTIYLRRRGQDMSAGFFRARKVVRL